MKYIGSVKYMENGKMEIRVFHGQTAHEVILLIEKKTQNANVVKIKVRKVGE